MNHDVECLSRFSPSAAPESPAKGVICVYGDELQGPGIRAGRRHGSLAGTSVGVNMTRH